MKKTTEGVIEVWLMSRGELCDRYDVFDLFSSSILLWWWWLCFLLFCLPSWWVGFISSQGIPEYCSLVQFAGIGQIPVEVVAAVVYLCYLNNWMYHLPQQWMSFVFDMCFRLITWSWPRWSNGLFQDTGSDDTNIFLNVGWSDVGVVDGYRGWLVIGCFSLFSSLGHGQYEPIYQPSPRLPFLRSKPPYKSLGIIECLIPITRTTRG